MRSRRGAGPTGTPETEHRRLVFANRSGDNHQQPPTGSPLHLQTRLVPTWRDRRLCRDKQLQTSNTAGQKGTSVNNSPRRRLRPSRTTLTSNKRQSQLMHVMCARALTHVQPWRLFPPSVNTPNQFGLLTWVTNKPTHPAPRPQPSYPHSSVSGRSIGHQVAVYRFFNFFFPL